VSDEVNEMSPTSDDDYETFEDKEHDRIFFGLLFDNLELHAVRYREQAESLIKLKEIEIINADMILNFSLEEGGCAFRISRDGGFEYNSLGWSSIDKSNKAKVKSLMEYFASCDASLTMEAGQ